MTFRSGTAVRRLSRGLRCKGLVGTLIGSPGGAAGADFAAGPQSGGSGTRWADRLLRAIPAVNDWVAHLFLFPLLFLPPCWRANSSQCCLEGPQRGPGPRTLSAPAVPRPVATSIHDDTCAPLALTSWRVVRREESEGRQPSSSTGPFNLGMPLSPPPQLALPLTAPLHRPPKPLLTSIANLPSSFSLRHPSPQSNCGPSFRLSGLPPPRGRRCRPLPLLQCIGRKSREADLSSPINEIKDKRPMFSIHGPDKRRPPE
jgi:hypothetical protein